MVCKDKSTTVFNVGKWGGNGRLAKGLELVLDKVMVVVGGTWVVGGVYINREEVGGRVALVIDIILEEDER